MENTYVEKILTAVLLLALIVLSFLILRPILLSIVMGFILAFIFNPLYEWTKKKTKSKNFATIIACSILVLVIALPLFFLTPVIINQSVKIYFEVQKIDFVSLIDSIVPSLTSDQVSSEIGSVTYSFVTNSVNSIVNSLADLLLQLPSLALHFVIILFTFVFILREKDLFIDYLKSLLPFAKDVQEKLFKATKDITGSVIYGQFIIGIIQGLIIGLGFFIFGVPNALLLTLLAMLAGIFPIVGPFIVWLPVVLYLIISPDSTTLSAVGVTIFGIFSSTIDNVLRPMFVSRKTQLNPLLILIGMIGGLFFFGVLGLLLGPLVIAYLLIVIEVYRTKKFSGNSLLNAPKK